MATTTPTPASTASVPAILHVRAGARADEWKAAYAGWIVMEWSLPSIERRVATLLPEYADAYQRLGDAAKWMLYPFLVLYLFGGVWVDGRFQPGAHADALLHRYSQAILFFVPTPSKPVGVSPHLLVAAPRIAAKLTLFEMVRSKTAARDDARDDAAECASLITQFVRAAVNGSSSGAVVLCEHTAVGGDESAIVRAHAPAWFRAAPPGVTWYVSAASPLRAEVTTYGGAVADEAGHDEVGALLLDADSYGGGQTALLDKAMGAANDLHRLLPRLREGATVVCAGAGDAALVRHALALVGADEITLDGATDAAGPPPTKGTAAAPGDGGWRAWRLLPPSSRPSSDHADAGL